MSNVTLAIAGRDYVVACAAGEEEQVRSLGRMIDTKVAAMGGHETQSETRNLLFASLLLADEVNELRKGNSPAPIAPAAAPANDGLADRLDALALRLENCATALEG